MHQALQQFLKLDYDAAAPGTLKLLRSAGDRDEALRLADMLAEKGLTYEELDRVSLLTCEPSLLDAPDLIGALRFAGDGIGDARRFCEGLAAAAIARGGEMRLNSKVTHLLVENGKVCGVRLGGHHHAGHISSCSS